MKIITYALGIAAAAMLFSGCVHRHHHYPRGGDYNQYDRQSGHYRTYPSERYEHHRRYESPRQWDRY